MKLVRLAIFITGITGLSMGGIMTLSSLRASQEEAILRANESSKAQATLFVDQFFGIIEATKNLNFALVKENPSSIPSYVTHRAVIKLNQGVPSEFESFVSTESPSRGSRSEFMDFGLEERVLEAIKRELSIADLQISKQALGSFSLTGMGGKEGIYLATPVYKIVNGITDSSSIDKINLILIDPVKAFGGLQKLSFSQEGAAYLINKKGKILAHSLSAYVGTDLKHISELKENIENLFIGAKTGSVGKYTNVDGVEEQYAFVRAGTTPFAFAVEQKARPPVLSAAWISDQVDSGPARKSFGFILVLIAVSLFAFAGISIWTSRQIGKQISENREARNEEPSIEMRDQVNERIAEKPLPSRRALNPQTQSTLKAPLAVSKMATSLIETREKIALEQEQLEAAVIGLSAPRDIARDFVSKIEKAYTLETVEKELVQVCSEISESPVLYFRYHRRNQSLALSSVAGDVKISNHSLMQAYIRKDIELQVEQMADDGKVASISNYGPISKLMIAHLNVAHFEAWAVTSHPEVSGQSKLVGVLVVLQAGMKSVMARPLLAKILKEGGNYLYAQSNKIRPRSSLYQIVSQTPILEDTDIS